MKRAPDFWQFGSSSLWQNLLSPLGCLYNCVSTSRANKPSSWKSPVPVICIGNLTMGGSGKTPSAIAIAKHLIEQGKTPYFLSRGYGGQMQGPLIVGAHGSQDVGDEPLLLKHTAPVCVSHDRIKGAKLCVEKGCDVIIMDDGFQNPYLHKDLSLLIVDGGYGHGNEKVFPAGPLRENLKNGLKRADAVLIIGQDKTNTTARVQAICPDLPVIHGLVQPLARPDFAGRKIIAFAGIGRPAKFFDTLTGLRYDVVETIPFPDHYPFIKEDIAKLKEKAKIIGARLVTTEKDMIRIPKEYRNGIDCLKITLAWTEQDMLDAVLAKVTG